MSNPLVTVQEGVLEGSTKIDYCGDKFHSFQGIPYAKPPLGKLRFKAPQPAEKWEGIRKAQKDGNECYAKCASPDSTKIVGSEDCLFLNVFTKKIQDSKLKPVMVWIHGGNFTMGSSTSVIYGPEYLITQDIVLVTLNYRLGVLGFLCLEDSSMEVTGNAGLKDIVLALKWVQNNIKQFCGDPNNVTVFGQSAGAAAAHYLMLSPITKGLFHKVIAQSGCSLNIWTIGKRNSAYELAEILGIVSDDDRVILEHLQNMPVEELYKGALKMKDKFCDGHMRPFCPVVERKSSQLAFLSNSPIEVLKSGNYQKVPLMMGNCSMDGMIYVPFVCEEHEGRLVVADNSIVPYTMNLRKDSTQFMSVANSIREFYFGNDKPFDDKEAICRILGDGNIILPLYNAAKYHLQSSTSPIYYYRFSLDTTLNKIKLKYSIKEPGACHGDDIFYLFKQLTSRLKLGSIEDISIKRMVKLWTNFAKYSNPTPDQNDSLLLVQWKPITEEKFYYLDIADDLELKVDLEKEAMEFWNNLFKNKALIF